MARFAFFNGGAGLNLQTKPKSKQEIAMRKKNIYICVFNLDFNQYICVFLLLICYIKFFYSRLLTSQIKNDL